MRLEALFKIYVAVLLGLLLWSFWASAQETNAATAKPAARPTAAVAALLDDPTPLTFGLNQVQALQTPFMGVPLWQYLASLIYVVLAFVVAGLLNWLIRAKLRQLVAKTENHLDDILLDLLGGPIKVIGFVIFLHIGLRLYPWPETAERFISKGLQVVVALSLTYVAVKVVDVLFNYWRQRATAEDRALRDQLIPFVRNIAKAFVVVVAVLLTCETLGVKITGLIASLSVGGLAVGLAAQDTLGNLFGAVAVLVDKPFKVGDRIKLDAVEGDVEQIGMRSTRVRTLDGHLVSIPNKTVGNATITNIARRPHIRTVMNIGITYDTPVEKLRRATEVLNEIFRGDPMTKDVVITFNRFTESALNIEVAHWWNGTDQKVYLQGLQELNLRVKERFDREGIDFAFPTQTLHVKSVAPAG